MEAFRQKKVLIFLSESDSNESEDILRESNGPTEAKSILHSYLNKLMRHEIF